MTRQYRRYAANALVGPNLLVTLFALPFAFIGVAHGQGFWEILFYVEIGLIEAALILYIVGGLNLGQRMFGRWA